MDDQMERSLAAFQQMEAKLLEENSGRVALPNAGTLVAICNDAGDAYSAGCEKFGLGNFCTQQIGAAPRSLGLAAALAFCAQGKGLWRGDPYRSNN